MSNNLTKASYEIAISLHVNCPHCKRVIILSTDTHIKNGVMGYFVPKTIKCFGCGKKSKL